MFGLEKFVGETVDSLGYKRLETIDGRVYFEGDEAAAARCNVNFRCAEKLYIIAGEFDAVTFDSLFEATKNIPWENYIEKNDAFPVAGHSIKSRLFSVTDCQRIIKKAIVERLFKAYNTSTLTESAAKIPIEFFILKDRVALMINTSGESLYKRGYRVATGEAPMRETLASALVQIARPFPDTLFYDPMCGSGTLVIEAAMYLKNMAPGARRPFAGESFKFLPSHIWKEARDEAQEKVRDIPLKIWASDVDPDMIEIAKKNAESAGICDIDFFVRDVADITTGGERATIVCNPPYGERLLDVKAAEALYRTMGRAFEREGFTRYFVFTSSEYFEKHFGKKADNARKMYNGMLRCFYYQYFKKK